MLSITMQNSEKETVFMSDDLFNILDLNAEEEKPFNMHVNYIEQMYPVLSLEKSKKNTTQIELHFFLGNHFFILMLFFDICRFYLQNFLLLPIY